MSSIAIKTKIKRKLRECEETSILLETNPEKKPIMVFAIPATPNTPKEKES
jgi:hypothetical protein